MLIFAHSIHNPRENLSLPMATGRPLLDDVLNKGGLELVDEELLEESLSLESMEAWFPFIFVASYLILLACFLACRQSRHSSPWPSPSASFFLGLDQVGTGARCAHGAPTVRNVWGNYTTFTPPIGPSQKSTTQQYWPPKNSQGMGFTCVSCRLN